MALWVLFYRRGLASLGPENSPSLSYRTCMIGNGNLYMGFPLVQCPTFTLFTWAFTIVSLGYWIS